ncbi:MAG: PQQ-binding-like beta-propeller repeat protein [Planctomycetaceae bacterium]
MMFDSWFSAPPYAVVPVLVGPLSTLIALLPAILMAVATALFSLLKPSAMKKFVLLLWAQKVAMLAIAAIGVAAWYGWGYLSAAPVEPVAAASGDAADWTMFRGGPERRGYVAGDIEDPGQPGRMTSFTRDGIETFYASPAVVGNRAYITCADIAPFTDRGAIYAIDTDTGKLVWEYDDRAYRATFSSPSIAGKYLVCGEGLHETRDARIVCLDLEASEKERRGVRLWEHRTQSHVESSPCIADGRVYIGAGDDGIYCLELEPEAAGDPRIVWHLDGKDYLDAESSPVVIDGKVYFGLGEGGKAICCVDAATGEEEWRIATPYPAFGCPTISKGRLYVGMGNGNFVETAEQVREKKLAALRAASRSDDEIAAEAARLGPVGEVWAIDLATREVAWKFRVDRTVLGAVACAGDRLFFGSRDGHFRCISTEGVELRKWNARAPIVSSPAVARAHVYFLTQEGMLHCLDAASLEPVWEMRIDTGGQSFSSPVVAHGRVFAGTSRNGFAMLGEPGRAKRDPVWAGPLGGPGKSGWDGTLTPERGTFAWRFPAPPPRRSRAPEPEIPRIVVPPAFVKKDVPRDADDDPRAKDAADSSAIEQSATVEAAFAYVAMEYQDRQGVAALRLADDRNAVAELAWFHETPLPVRRSPAATVTQVFCVTGETGDASRELCCLDAATGEPLWAAAVADDAPGDFIIDEIGLLVADGGDTLTRIPLEGFAPGPKAEKQWTAQVRAVRGAPVRLGDLVVAAAEQRLSVLDAPTGRTLWSMPRGSRSNPLVTGDDALARIWVAGDSASKSGVHACRIHDGERVAAIACGPVSSPLVTHDGTLACTNEAGEIVMWNAETAEEFARIPGAFPAHPPLIADDVLLFVDAQRESIQRHDLRTEKTTRWMDTAWLGKITTPPILIDSHLYFATDQRGLICAKPADR